MAHHSLRPRPFRPTWELALALLGHACIGGGIVAGEWLTKPSQPLIDLDKVTMVVVAPPKSTRSLPDKASRRPDPPKGRPDSPAPPTPTPASDMALHSPEAPERSGAPDRSDARQELLNQARREQLLRDQSAAIGPEDRMATDPDGVDPEDALIGPAGVGPSDPELARFVVACRNAILPHWTPLPSTVQANPDLSVSVLVTVAADGSLGAPELVRRSGDASFDRSAILAVTKTGRLPAPPEKFRAAAAAGVLVTLAAQDKL